MSTVAPVMRGVEQIPWLYDAAMRLMELTGLGRWRAWLTAGASGRVLEVGCGTGRNLPRYPAGALVVAFDPAPESLARAHHRAPHVPLVRASAEALPFRDGAFDTVVSSLVFCSVPDAGRGLREVRRVLKSDGSLRMLEHVRSTSSLWARVQDWYQPAWTAFTGGCHPNRQTEQAVRDAGFAIDQTQRRASGTMRRLVAHPEAAPRLNA